jgi:hypothetical protein
VEGCLPTFEFELAMIPPVVVEPEAKKHGGNQHAVDDDSRGEFEHDPTFWEQVSRLQISSIPAGSLAIPPPAKKTRRENPARLR